jgi:hypothetical protein
VADSRHQCCRWHRPYLDWLAEHLSRQALPLQVPQQSGHAQLQSRVPLLSNADSIKVPALG